MNKRRAGGGSSVLSDDADCPVSKDRPDSGGQGSSLLSDPDMRAVAERCRAFLERLPPPLAEAGGRLLDRVSTDNWTLEWSLPRWLGNAFGLESDQAQALVLSNVLGLAYVRLQDDLVDGEVAGVSHRSAPLLATALYAHWLQHYVRLFDSASPFWTYFDEFMIQWVRATSDTDEPLAAGPSFVEEGHLLRLAERGAPLKICCVGACLLAGREEAIPLLISAADHLLIAAVLLDHAVDWQADLEAGRYNVFIAYASLARQSPENQKANLLGVLNEIYIGDAARPYFDQVCEHLRQAERLAEPVACQELEQYLCDLQRQAIAYADGLRDKAKARLRAATEQLLGTPTPSAVATIQKERR